MWKQMSCADSKTARLWKPWDDNERNVSVCVGACVCTCLAARRHGERTVLYVFAFVHLPAYIQAGTLFVRLLWFVSICLLLFLSPSWPQHNFKAAAPVDLFHPAPSHTEFQLLVCTSVLAKAGYYLSLSWTQCTDRLPGNTTRRERWQAITWEVVLGDSAAVLE